MTLTPPTQALLDTAFASVGSAQQATSDHDVAKQNLAAAQAAEANAASAETFAHKKSTADSVAALQAIAAELGIPFTAPAAQKK